MAQIHWLTAVSAPFTTAADWTGGVVPGPGDDAILDATGGPYTVFSKAASQVVNSVQLTAGATLSVASNKTFTITNGTGSGANDGIIIVNQGATLFAGGTINNHHGIVLTGSGKNSNLTLLSNTTLTGGGSVNLDNNIHNVISGAFTLENVDNTIQGSGQVGAGGMTVINDAKGVINANGGHNGVGYDLDLFSTSPLVNNGLIETSNWGILVVAGTTIDSSGATGPAPIHASGSGRIDLLDSALSGGSVTIDAGSSLYATGTKVSAIDVGAGTLDNEGSLYVSSGELDVTSAATVINNGVVGSIGKSVLVLYKTTVNSSGSGSAPAILDGGTSRIDLYDTTLTGGGVSIASGATLWSTGDAASTIDTGAGVFSNAGTIYANGSGISGGGGLTINGAVSNGGTLFAYLGSLEVIGAVTGKGTGKINGGTLQLDSTFTQNVTFATGATGELVLGQSKGYTGSITGFSKTSANQLDLKDIGFSGTTTATYAGTTSSGVLTVTDGVNTAHIKLIGNYTTSTFTVASDGSGGTLVSDPASHSASASRLVSAMAGLGSHAASAALHVSPAFHPGHSLLASARL